MHDERPPALSFEEALDRVTNAPYVSRTRVGRELARAVARRMMTPEQIDQIRAAAQARREELTARRYSHAEPTLADVVAETGIAAPAETARVAVPEASVPAPTEWTPSSILIKMDAWEQNRREFPSIDQSVPVGDRVDPTDYPDEP